MKGLLAGMIEIVTEAETLRAIQTEFGLTGSFKDKPIAEWLAKHNPSELEYQRARDNFTGKPFLICSSLLSHMMKVGRDAFLK